MNTDNRIIFMSTFDLNRMKATLDPKGVPPAGGVAHSRKSKPKVSTVVKRGEALIQAKSKYTGLPKGPGNADEQDALLEKWAEDKYPFPLTQDIDTHHGILVSRGAFSVPSSRSKTARRTAMLDYLRLCKIILTQEQLCTLALGTGRFRKAYWICCSLYGHHKRLENTSKTEKLTTTSVGDSDIVKEKKALLLEQSNALKECQREWQRKIEALRVANSELLGVMGALQVSTDELRDDLTVDYPAEPVAPATEDSHPLGGEGFLSEGDEGEEGDEGDAYSGAAEQQIFVE